MRNHKCQERTSRNDLVQSSHKSSGSAEQSPRLNQIRDQSIDSAEMLGEKPLAALPECPCQKYLQSQSPGRHSIAEESRSSLRPLPGPAGRSPHTEAPEPQDSPVETTALA